MSEEVCARTRLIPLVVVVFISVESIFAPKTASELLTFVPKLTDFSRLVLGLGQKTNE